MSKQKCQKCGSGFLWVHGELLKCGECDHEWKKEVDNDYTATLRVLYEYTKSDAPPRWDSLYGLEQYCIRQKGKG